MSTIVPVGIGAFVLGASLMASAPNESIMTQLTDEVEGIIDQRTELAQSEAAFSDLTAAMAEVAAQLNYCLLYTSPSPRDS